MGDYMVIETVEYLVQADNAESAEERFLEAEPGAYLVGVRQRDIVELENA